MKYPLARATIQKLCLYEPSLCTVNKSFAGTFLQKSPILQSKLQEIENFIIQFPRFQHKNAFNCLTFKSIRQYKRFYGTQQMTEISSLTGNHTNAFHAFQVRVYVADTDFSGVVYHARYLEFFERGRSEFLRDTGFNNKMLASGVEGEKLFFVVRHMEIKFSRSAQIDNLLTIKTRINHIQGARFFMEQYILREDEMLVTAKVEIALINETGKPRRLPKSLFSTVLV